VEAETFMGAFYGLGFIHAKDRLWQMHFYKHLTHGRLSELIGSHGVPIDRYMRTIGLPRATRSDYETMDANNRLMFENYAAGVNKVAENVKVYPLEFKMLWTEFEPWTPQDSLAMHQFMLYFLSKDWFFEYIRGRLTEVYDRETVNKLMPFRKEDYYPWEEDIETITDEELKRVGMYVEDNADSLFNIDDRLLHLHEYRGSLNVTAETSKDHIPFEVLGRQDSGGSNCYVVHGRLTKSGKPIITCDPHLNK
jgi:penicillin G amidase